METKTDNFLPQDYTAPVSGGNYMKIQQGENKIRIMSRPIIGWLDWKDKTPYRFRFNQKPDKAFSPDKPIKHFWAMLVWNYNDEAVQILEITQSTIQKAIQDLTRDEDWGAPYTYDIKIVRKGQDLKTEYSITPSPKKKVDDEIYRIALEKPCNLEALFKSEDPWIVTNVHTPLEISDLPF